MNDLEQLLSQPLEQVEDKGFSEGVMRDINGYYRRRRWFMISVSALLAAALLFIAYLMPWQPIYAEIVSLLSLNSELQSNMPALDIQPMIKQILQHPLALLCILLAMTTIFSWQEN